MLVINCHAGAAAASRRIFKYSLYCREIVPLRFAAVPNDDTALLSSLTALARWLASALARSFRRARQSVMVSGRSSEEGMVAGAAPEPPAATACESCP